MNLFRKKMSVKLTDSEKRRKKRLLKQLAPNTQNSICYTSAFETGLMHIVDDEYSKMVKLGDLDYEVVSVEEQQIIAESYAEALNTLDRHSRYQLFIYNRKLDATILDTLLLPYQGDGFDDYRLEINDLMKKNYERDEKNFEIEKYAIFTTTAKDKKQANRQLNVTIQNFAKRFEERDVPLTLKMLTGIERLKVMATILRPEHYLHMTYRDLLLTGATTKAFIAPTQLKFHETTFQLDNKYVKVLFIRDYPKYLEDRLIQEFCSRGRELAISIHATPYDINSIRTDLQVKRNLNNAEIVRQQRSNFKEGLSDDLISGMAREVEETTASILEEMKENNQKLFSGIFSILLMEDSPETLEEAVQDLKEVAGTWQVNLEDVYRRQEEALNTILPLGKPYLDVESNYMRDMTTNNVATQIPFTTVELQSPTGQYYGQNQKSNNLITIDRKKDLITPSGLILGSSGSGKGMTVKWNQLLTLLTTTNDRMIIVDPESEYLKIGKQFGAQIVNIAAGTKNSLNILDMADIELLDEEDRQADLVKEKANLLSSLFESVLKEYTDAEIGIVDRVTTLTYQQFEEVDRMPTLRDWHEILKQQTDPIAKQLVLKVEPYTIGSQDIFAHETNIDLSDRLIIFNIKNLNDNLKPFAMKIILDQIWRQVVANQGKSTTWLFFDELQLNFDTEENASWFMKLWSRVRKYGAIPTGITQNPSTLLEKTEGQKMISNTEFIILLRQKPVDLQYLKQMMNIPTPLLKYVGERVQAGTGLISAGGVIVPFKNEIPRNTKLFELMNTDA